MQAFVSSAVLLSVLLLQMCLKSERNTESDTYLTAEDLIAEDTISSESMVSQMPDSVSTHVNEVSTELAFLELSRAAIDRQCGKCHHSNRSTNEVALSIFNLANECWYCTLSEEQIPGLQSRTMDKDDFSKEEKEALRRVIEEVERGR